MISSQASGPGPLDGVRVVDMTAALAGPFCTLLLASLGAEVIKVERPGGGDFGRTNPPYVGPDGVVLEAASDDDFSISILNRTRNKRSVTLDARTSEGRALLHRLIATADIFVQNYSAGAVAALGADYDTLIGVRPSLVYCSIDGVSEGSEYETTKTMDIIIQALSGIMDVTGEQDGPPNRVGIPVGDLFAPVFAVGAILAALRVAERTGAGQKVSVSLVDSLSLLVASEHFDALSAANIPKRSGTSHPRLAPFGVYRCIDGYVAVAAFQDNWFRQLCMAIGRPDMAADERYRTRTRRVSAATEINAAIEGWTATQTKSHVIAVLGVEAEVPCAPVRAVEDVLGDKSMRRSGAISDLPHPDATVTTGLAASGVPWRFSTSHVSLDRPAPRLGADSRAVLSELGLGDAELDALEHERII